MFLPERTLEKRLQKMLAEDVGQGDLTSSLIVPEHDTSEAELVVNESGVIAGMEEAKALLKTLELRVEDMVSDGTKIEAGNILLRVHGDTRTILSAERTLLNIISRMSGIATTTRRLVEKLRVAGLKTKIACTRKVAPGLLYFDKKAVSIGGGDTHRFHLDDMILIKDNHITVAGSVEKAIEKVKKAVSFSKKIEIEVTKTEDALIATKAGVDIVMLDNFSSEQIAGTIELLEKKGLHGRVLLEASGGITTKNILKYASTGVDIISLGEITDSTKSLDMSLRIKKTNLQVKA